MVMYVEVAALRLLTSEPLKNASPLNDMIGRPRCSRKVVHKGRINEDWILGLLLSSANETVSGFVGQLSIGLLRQVHGLLEAYTCLPVAALTREIVACTRSNCINLAIMHLPNPSGVERST